VSDTTAKPVYSSYEAALAAATRQQRAYGIVTGVIRQADDRWVLRYDITGGQS
jgi:hypothetical protein